VVSLGSNISSLRTQRFLGQATTLNSIVSERLSSGQRINRASDDAAGLAIADALKSDARLTTVAQRNINDGISALNIIDSALESQTGILTRMLELAEQSANGVYGEEQRASLNIEYQALIKEYGRIGDVTKFNGLNLLTSGRQNSLTDLIMQIGISGEQDSTLSVALSNSATLSGLAAAGVVWGSATLPPEGLGIFQDASSFQQLSDLFNGQLLSVSVRDSAGNERSLLLGLNYLNSSSSYEIRIYAQQGDIGPAGYIESTLGFVVGSNPDDYMPIGAIAFSVDSNTGQIIGGGGLSTNLLFNSGTATANLALDFSGLTFEAPPAVGPGDIVTNTSTNLSSIDFTGIESSSRALVALTTIQNRITELSSLRATVGSAQSRLAVAINVNASAKENFTAAESRIRDADIAQETSNLVSTQIRQQLAASVLSQANSLPQLALTILQG
jgi:flagellin